MLEHGGGLLCAARRYGIARERWLDLSTGVSPWSWLEENPVELPGECWRRLPEDGDGLYEAAQAYYGAPALPVAGSQSAIQLLPRLRAPGRVGVLRHSYAEHAERWQRERHAVLRLQAGAVEPAIDALDVLVLVNPDNPTGSRVEPAQLLAWHERLARRGGWLVVDEAFVDAQPALSVASSASREGLIVLRSLGKFFGLAGARLGFVLASAPLLERLREMQGPWAVSGPSRHLAALALRDAAWQRRQCERLWAACARLRALLDQAGLAQGGGSALFEWRRCAQAVELQDALARQGILLRRFDEPASLRFGLPACEDQWQRLEGALRSCSPLPRAGEGSGERVFASQVPSPGAARRPLPHAGEGR